MKTFLYIILAALIGLSGPYNSSRIWAYTVEECVECHREGSPESMLHISVEQFDSSIHGREGMDCADCHSGVEGQEHEKIKGSGAVQCLACHDQENRHGLGSQAGDRPQCHSCHSRHGILEKGNNLSSIHPDRLGETCRGCHPVECGESDLLSWLPSLQIASHNKQDFGRAYEKSNCLGCHQGSAAHGERHPINDQDCHQCHLSREGRPGLWGTMHPRADLNQQPGTFAAGVVYLIFFVLLLGGGFGFYVKRHKSSNKK